ncbi:16740_t:CDS:10, partial [Acaulospora morrowiae]
MSHLTEFVQRPDFGRLGKGIRVRSNFFEVFSLPKDKIIQYDVTITPNVPPALNRKIYAEFEKENLASTLHHTRVVFDGRKNIFASRQLPFGEVATFDVTLPENDGFVSTRRTPRAFKIKMKKTSVIIMEELHRFLEGRGRLTPNCLTGIMAIDVLIRHLPSMKSVTVGRSFFTRDDTTALAGGIEIWQGYYQSARPAKGKIMINVDLSATAFYEAGPLVTLITKLLGRRTPDDLRRGITEKERIKLEKSIKNLKIKVIHRGEVTSKRRFKINKITATSANQTMFNAGDGSTTNVADYFEKTYSQRLAYPHLPCVVVAKNVCLPLEVCEVIDGQRYIRKLNERQTADMIRFTCQPPYLRANKILQGVDTLNYRGNEYLQQFGVNVSNDMVVTPARVLSAPTLQYHPTSREPSIVPHEGSWNMKGKKVAQGATLGSWSIIAFGSDSEFPHRAIQAFTRELVITCQENGVNIPNRTPPIMHSNPQGDIEATLKQSWLRAGNAAKAQPQLILCILPNTGVPLYAEIKRVTDTIIGVPSQCIQGRHMMQAKKQYCANVCLKLNVKLGGMNLYITPTQIPFISDRPTILLGADISHPAAGDPSRPSVSAVCASLDARASRYSATIRIQTGRTEIIADLASMVKDLLKNFYQTCGRKPERILFYRDGVSEGQFTQVMNGEINAVRMACASLSETYKPSITFVIVQKRHHIRFFPLDKKDADRTGNCLPGTVVESTITHPFEFDFYIQSHAGLQGTSRPTHYYILYDENQFSADGIQALSYNLCYLYARCTRAVSLVPPVYYAHIVCRRARFHSRSEHWSDTESSEEGAGQASSFAIVKPELARGKEKPDVEDLNPTQQSTPS